MLIVEDETRLLRTIRDGLAEEGDETVPSRNGEAALLVAQAQSIELGFGPLFSLADGPNRNP